MSSDRFKGLIVAFKTDLPQESVEQIANVLRWLDGVADVQLITAEPMADMSAHMRTEAIWRQRLIGMLDDAERASRWQDAMRKADNL